MSRCAFPRALRLLSESDFQPLFKSPDYRAGGRHLLLLAAENRRTVPRLGLVVGRKRVRRAVHRNLIKRQARESFRLRQDTLTGLDVLVLVRANLSRPDRASVRQELEQVWDKLLAKRSQA